MFLNLIHKKMKIKDFTELVSISLEELAKLLQEARRELVKIQMGVKTGQEKNTSKYPAQRKYVAQILTAMRSKEISEAVL